MQSGIKTLDDLRAASEADLEKAGLDTMEVRSVFAKVERELGGRLDWRVHHEQKKAARAARRARLQQKKERAGAQRAADGEL